MSAAISRRPPPGPRGLEVLRFFGGGSFAGTLRFCAEVTERYGPIASFTLLGRRLHLVAAPELVREVLVVQQHRFARANGAAILRDLVGRSMLTVDEPRHVEQRRVVQPAFHARRIAQYGRAMLEEIARAAQAWPDGPIDMSAAMMRLALAIVGRALFGSDVRASADTLETILAGAMRDISTLGAILEALPTWANAIRVRAPIPANARLAHAHRTMTAVVEALIAERRAACVDDDGDLLGMLLAHAAGDPRYDAQAVADELVTLLLAGHETTANALAWAWDALARDSALQDRLATEVQTTAGARALTVDDIAALRWCSATFAEALRLYPPASAFGRRAIEACSLGGYRIAPGDGILLSPFVSHRNPALFADPLAFAPERWFGAELPPFAYFPFGGGARLCIGEAFARMEGTLAIAAIVQRFRVSLVDPAPVEIAAQATLRPARPIVLALTRRA